MNNPDSQEPIPTPLTGTPEEIYPSPDIMEWTERARAGFERMDRDPEYERSIRQRIF